MQCEDHDKMLIELSKEYSELRRRQNLLGWEPLLLPVQKGWIRFFVLREDVAQSKQAEFFEGVLKKINTYDWSDRRNFLVKRRFRGRKYYVVKPQKLKELYSWEFERLEFDEKERKYFDEQYIYHKNYREPSIRYVFNEPWRFVLRVRPNIIDKVRIMDHELQARMRWISQYQEWNGLNGRTNRLIYGRSWWRKRYGERESERNPLKNKPVTHVLDLFRNR